MSLLDPSLISPGGTGGEPVVRLGVPLLEENLSDLRGHADDFTLGAGYTFTVLDPTDNDVIGCVYLYPSASEEWEVTVQSWVRGRQIEPRRTTRRRHRTLARHRLAMEARGPLRSLSRNGTLMPLPGCVIPPRQRSWL